MDSALFFVLPLGFSFALLIVRIVRMVNVRKSLPRSLADQELVKWYPAIKLACPCKEHRRRLRRRQRGKFPIIVPVFYLDDYQ